MSAVKPSVFFAGLASSLEATKTPIARELDHFVTVITVIASSFGVVFAITGSALGFPFLDTAVLCIGVIVGNVPEGAAVIFFFDCGGRFKYGWTCCVLILLPFEPVVEREQVLSVAEPLLLPDASVVGLTPRNLSHLYSISE